MSLVRVWLFPIMWFGYISYWWAVSKDVKETERQEPAASRALRLVLVLCAAVLLLVPRVRMPLLGNRFVPSGELSFWSGAAITATGLLFSIWARRHLGTNWSQAVTLKQGHELITSGPYVFVRHPIYTGLLLAFVGTAITRGEWRGVLAVGLVFFALWQKLRLEEKWLLEQFGECYQDYSRRVRAIVPFLL
jgi:protein-S-isoprenylcysteine O-methyltransferase Ste14